LKEIKDLSKETMIRALLVNCSVLLLLTSSLGQSQTDTGSIPKPAVAVSFERQNVRESDNLFVDIWISNEADVDLSRIALHVALPDFIKWRALASSDKPGTLLENQDEPLASISPGRRAANLWRSDQNGNDEAIQLGKKSAKVGTCLTGSKRR
jgi:hypothetical protein